jgi:hypothetical protein
MESDHYMAMWRGIIIYIYRLYISILIILIHIRGWLWGNNHPVPVLHVSSRAWPEVRCMARHTVLKAPCPLVINGGEVIVTCLWMFMDVGNFTKIGENS